MRIGLNDFTDFLLASASQRPALVRRLVVAYKRSEYNPSHNFWHQLRQAFRRYWRDGGTDASILTSVVERAAGPKRSRFESATRGFLRFRGRKRLRWEEPPVLHWRHGDLDVSCTPDLALTDGTRHWLIRLHYLPSPPSRARVSIISAILERAAAISGRKDVAPALLDLERGTLRTSGASRRLAETLDLEADTLIAYWRRYEAS